MGTQPMLVSRKPTFTQVTGSRTSQGLPEEKSRLHVTPVSKQFPLPALKRPLHCDDLLLYSSSPVSTPDVDPTMEHDHKGGATEVDTSTGAIRGQYTSTGFDDHSLLPNEDSMSDVTDLLQNVISKTTLLPTAFDRTFQQDLASLDTLHSDYSSKSYVVSLHHSTSQEHTQDSEAGGTGQSRFLQSDRLSGTQWSGAADRITGTTGHHLSQATSDESQTLSRTLTGTAASSQTIYQTFPTSATKTSDREWHDTAVYGSNLSARVSKQGALLILCSVLGGCLALIGVFIIHCFILRHFHRHAGGSTPILPSQLVVDTPEKSAKILPRTAEVSHFSNNT
ncbi:unnamed protein product [Penicillium salamii]|uniref:Uncharacterized protein n=1 Tax=Penicillium salamii TaxID=1612424 RepID=A0A9W4NYG4_9EURO|nr:unnamed protein product [Penicillium salamii]CAG8291560.1 unnamed protein product [Penicillium salamii]CAG8315105.1 unnamed protein product [Penicillium salamii]CAG8351126.1 unnamed protein product [Penicillium salamii]CAG8428562.1 unnamed protein product [Penicillium salamii]